MILAINAGNSLVSRSCARCDSVPFRLKLVAYWRPTAVAIAVVPIAIASHAITTRRRCRMHQRASLSKMSLLRADRTKRLPFARTSERVSRRRRPGHSPFYTDSALSGV